MNLNTFTIPQLKTLKEVVDRSVDHWEKNVQFLWTNLNRVYFLHSTYNYFVAAPDLQISVFPKDGSTFQEFIHYGSSACSCCLLVKNMMEENGDEMRGTLLCKKYCPLYLFSGYDCTSPKAPWMNFFEHLKSQKEKVIKVETATLGFKILSWILNIQRWLSLNM